MKKNMQIIVILVVIALALLVVFGFFGIGGFNFFTAAPTTNSEAGLSPQALLAQVQQSGSVSSLQFADVSVGSGAELAPGDAVEVAYTGVLPDGTVFDSTQAHGGTPLSLVVAADGSLHTPDGGGLITGWSQGMAGMKEGGVRILAIPPALGYGANAVGPIPANSTLIFQVQLVKVTSPSAASTTPAQ